MKKIVNKKKIATKKEMKRKSDEEIEMQNISANIYMTSCDAYCLTCIPMTA